MAKVAVNMKMEEELKDRISERARKDFRTMSNLIEKVMTEYLDEADRKGTASEG